MFYSEIGSTRVRGINERILWEEGKDDEYHKFWRKYLVSLIYDIFIPPATADYPKIEQKKAYIMVFKDKMDYNKTGTFAWTCAVLNLHPDYVKKAVIAVYTMYEKEGGKITKIGINRVLEQYGIKRKVNKNKPEHSMKKAGNFADKFFDNLGITE